MSTRRGLRYRRNTVRMASATAMSAVSAAIRRSSERRCAYIGSGSDCARVRAARRRVIRSCAAAAWESKIPPTATCGATGAPVTPGTPPTAGEGETVPPTAPTGDLPPPRRISDVSAAAPTATPPRPRPPPRRLRSRIRDCLEAIRLFLLDMKKSAPEIGVHRVDVRAVNGQTWGLAPVFAFRFGIFGRIRPLNPYAAAPANRTRAPR